MKAGTGNTISAIGGESTTINHIELGVSTADVTGTFTAGAINTATDGGASWGSNQWANGAVQITGGTGAGQYREIVSSSATGIVVNPYWDTIPDATSTYGLWIQACLGTTIEGVYGEGDSTSNPNWLKIFPGANGTQVSGGQISSLGTGKVVTQLMRRFEDRLNPNWWTDPFSITFSVSALAAAQTNLALKPVGWTRNNLSPLGIWHITGMDISMNGNIAAGTCNIQVTRNGTAITDMTTTLTAANTNIAGGGSTRQWYFPAQMFEATTNYQQLGVIVTTSAGWTAGLDLFVTLWVQQR
jgi:hypothetical protein